MHTLAKEAADTLVTAGPVALWERPEHARHVGLIIAAAAYLELDLGYCFASLLKAPPGAGIQMYFAIRGDQAKQALLRSTAQTVVRGTNGLILQAILTFAYGTLARRHRVAHHLWGYSIDLPDAALLADAQAAWQLASERQAHFYRLGKTRSSRKLMSLGRPPLMDRKNISVYSVKDLRSIYDDLVHASRLFWWFWQMRGVSRGKPNKRRDELLREPHLQTTLRELRRAARVARTAQKQQPPPNPAIGW